MNHLFNLLEFQSKKKDYLGATVWWHVNQCSMSIEHVKSLLSSNNLNKDLISEVSAKVAFKRAGKAVSKIHTTDEEIRFSRSISDTSSEAVLGVIAEKTDVANDKLNYRQQTTAKLNKINGQIEVHGFGEEEFKEHYNEYKHNISDNDIRNLIKLVVDRIGGFTLRESGGVYFVPKLKIETLSNIEKFISELNCGEVSIMRTSNSNSERKIVWTGAEEEISRKLEKIKFAVGNIERRLPFVQRQLEKFVQIQNMSEYYISLCDASEFSGKIKNKLAEVENQISDKISEIKKEKGKLECIVMDL